jgi:hypothetical protein
MAGRRKAAAPQSDSDLAVSIGLLAFPFGRALLGKCHLAFNGVCAVKHRASLSASLPDISVSRK